MGLPLKGQFASGHVMHDAAGIPGVILMNQVFQLLDGRKPSTVICRTWRLLFPGHLSKSLGLRQSPGVPACRESFLEIQVVATHPAVCTCALKSFNAKGQLYYLKWVHNLHIHPFKDILNLSQ